MLRLAPSHSPLWRTPPGAQLGPDPTGPLALTPWQERLLDALVTGVPDARLPALAEELGTSPAEAADFVAGIAHALVPRTPADPRAAVELPADLAAGEESALVGALVAAGVDVTAVARWPLERPGAPVLVVAHRLVDPRRAAALVAQDVVHLPVELSGDRVTVGPLVVPGQGPCLACVHAARRDADPEWPLLAAQLLGRSAVPTASVLLLETAVLAARLLRGDATGAAVSVRSADVRRVWHVHRPHADCLCRSPGGSATAPDPAIPTSGPTTATGYARLA